MRIRFPLYAALLPLMTAASATALLWAGLAAAAPSIGSELFPETRDWLDVDDLPVVDDQTLDNLAPELQRILRASPQTAEWGDSNACSIVERMFDLNDRSMGAFFRLDADGDGHEDILYTGSYHCAEGRLTVLFSGTGSSYELRQHSVFNAQTLRVEPGKSGGEPQFLIYAPGCCGSFTDMYSNQKSSFTVFAWLEPPTLLPAALPVRVGNLATLRMPPAVLRMSPMVNNEYDENMSDAHGTAFMGNILGVFIPPPQEENECAGSVLGYDPSKEWAFVVLNNQCRAVYSHDARPGGRGLDRVGWVQVKDTTPLTDAAPDKPGAAPSTPVPSGKADAVSGNTAAEGETRNEPSASPTGSSGQHP